MGNTNTDQLQVPDGAPFWVDRELIGLTIETWQPYYRGRIAEEEALEIILAIARASEGWRWS